MSGPERNDAGTRLSTTKRILLEKRLRGEWPRGRHDDTIARRESSGPVPLSFAQQRLWFLDRFRPDSALYNLPSTFRIAGAIDVDVLSRSLDAILERHDALRTTFPAIDGNPRQVVAPAARVDLRVLAVDDVPAAVREIRAMELVTEEVRRPFDLSAGPLFRSLLIRLGEADHILVVNMHHIVADAWSLGIFMGELVELYEAYAAGRAPSLPSLPIQYTDFAAWQRDWLRGEVLESQLGFWREELSGGPGILELPTDRPRPAVQSFRGEAVSVDLPGDVAAAVRVLSGREKTTLFMVMYAAFVELLCRYTGQDDISVGTPIAGRNRVELERVIGFFVNTLVLRTILSGEMTFRELLGQVKETVLGAFGHQDVPFEKLVEELEPERDTSRSPLFQVVFALNSISSTDLRLGGACLEAVGTHSGTAKFELILTAVAGEEDISVIFSYNSDLFDRETIDRMAGHYITVLRRVADNPDIRPPELEFLSDEESRCILLDWNRTQTDYPRDRCMHRLFEERVTRIPDAAAAVFEDEHITYDVLNRRANRLARRLQDAGIKSEVTIGVCMERSLWVPIALLGILKAGGVYLPLDPEYPVERLAFMLQDARAAALVTVERMAGRFPRCETDVLCIDREWDAIARRDGENPDVPVAPENLAYCIYTSGSTGRPKGVAIHHGGLTNLIYWHRRVYGLGEGERTTQMSGLSFDLSVWEMCPSLVSGATLYIPDEETRLSLRRQIAWLRDCMIDVCTLATPIAEAIMEENWPSSITMRSLLTGGDKLHGAPKSSMPFRLYNNYGPTESTVIATWTLVSPDGDGAAPLIGRPVDNTCVYVLDPHGNPVPVGVSGELYIGGEALGRGYLARPGLTAERFLPDPFAPHPGGRIYRTGDLVRFRPGGDIEFFGRIDSQIKIRGYRIELGEIEVVLGTHPAVREAVVALWTDAAGEKRLIGYAVPRTGRTPSEDELKRFLGDRLPGYMVPATMIMLDSLPLTPNGKVDRRALPSPLPYRPEGGVTFEAPRSEAERTIAGVWRDLLQLDRIGIHDNFFDIGGHSMLLVQAHSKLQKSFDADISIIDMFKYPTVDALARYVQREISASSFAESEKRGRTRRAALGRRKMKRTGAATREKGARSRQ